MTRWRIPLITLALIPATVAACIGSVQWFLGIDREGDSKAFPYFFLFLHPDMDEHWRRVGRHPVSKAAWKNIFAEWVRLHCRIGDVEAPAKLLPFFGAVLGLAFCGLLWWLW